MTRNDQVLHTIASAQAMLHCSRWKIYDLHRAGRLEMVKLGRHSRITDKSLRKLVKELPRRQYEPA
jgi:excisionase family DNA binding protein